MLENILTYYIVIIVLLHSYYNDRIMITIK